MTYTAIEQLLQNHMGLSPVSIGHSAIAQAVQQRMRQRGIDSVESYWQRLRDSASELNELITLVVVPETWFFRDQQPFQALLEYLKDNRNKWPASGPLRILSVPCSSGEEPYTIAMSLLDAGFSPQTFHIDAIDICQANLDRARAALYREHSFRSNDLSFRARYFLHNETGYLLQSRVRDCVHFKQGNLLASDFLPEAIPYHIIFCRNLLIYFDRPTQGKALLVLERLLKKTGLLFLGHAETGVLSGRDYIPLAYERSFGFIYGTKHQPHAWSPPATFCLPQRRSRPVSPITTPPVASAGTIHSIPDHSPPLATQDLETATRLANDGHLVEATAHLEQQLSAGGPNAQAFYLLALLRESVGETQTAESLLRKALYLEPHHYEALIQLSLLLERQGDQVNAERLRERAKRSFEQQRTGTALADKT